MNLSRTQLSRYAHGMVKTSSGSTPDGPGLTALPGQPVLAAGDRVALVLHRVDANTLPLEVVHDVNR